MTVLVTGGTGYIGSHTVVKLIEDKKDVVIIDNLSNSNINVLDRIKEITGVKPDFIKADVCDREAVFAAFEKYKPDAILHFAGLKAVGESVQKPVEYYKNNLNSTLTLIEAMKKYGCKTIVFSSSATVYGDPAFVPITEECPLSVPASPYGKTKLMCEQILRDSQIAMPDLSVVILRYFNPIGAHPSGLIGEMPNGIPNNLLPYVAQVAAGKLEKLSVYGNDYPTHDGTGVRDYIHVEDLAQGHIDALNHCGGKSGVYTFNLGTGTGYSVLDIVNAFSRVNNVKVPYVIAPRRSGDIATCYADSSKAQKELGWKAVHTLEDMCKSAWEFTKRATGLEK